MQTSERRRQESDGNSGAMKMGGIIAALRRRVLLGELRPGERMPTWDAMETEFGVGRPTLMRALAQLKEDGLVVADSTRGTYVAQRPPHLYRYALVFPQGPGQSGWNQFWAELDAMAPVLARQIDREIPVFYWTEPHPDNESYLRLLREARAGRLAGVIVVGGGAMIEPAAREALGLPAVALQAAFPHPRDIPIIDSDYDSFISASLKWLKSQNRRRPAVLTNVYNSLERIMPRLEEFGMSAEPCWLQGVDTHHAWWAGQIVRLLLHHAQADRPDALIVTDDNLAEPAIAAIVESGIRVPQDFSIVTHSNFTRPVTATLPMLRLGFDSVKMIKLAVEAIDKLRANQAFPSVHLLAAEPIDSKTLARPTRSGRGSEFKAKETDLKSRPGSQ